MGQAAGRRDPELGDHHRHAGVVELEGREVACVGVAAAGVLEVLQPGLVPQEIRVVGVGVVACEVASGPGGRHGDVVRVDAHQIFGRQRLFGMSQGIGGRPVGEGEGHGDAACRFLGGGVIEHLGQPRSPWDWRLAREEKYLPR